MNPIGMHYGFWSHNWDEIAYIPLMAVSYTHLTLPTNREV